MEVYGTIKLPLNVKLFLSIYLASRLRNEDTEWKYRTKRPVHMISLQGAWTDGTATVAACCPASFSPELSPFLGRSWRFPSPPRSPWLSPGQRPRCHVSEAFLLVFQYSFPRLPGPSRHLPPLPCLRQSGGPERKENLRFASERKRSSTGKEAPRKGEIQTFK